MSLKKLSETSHSQVEINCGITLENVQVLEDSLDKMMLVLGFLLTLATSSDRGFYTLVKAISVIVVADPFNEFVQGKLSLNVNHNCRHLLSIVQFSITPLLGEDC